MAQEGTREYLAIPKGRGFVYAYDNQLYNRVKTEGRTKYLKCSKLGCDGSAKIVNDLFFLGVCIPLSVTDRPGFQLLGRVAVPPTICWSVCRLSSACPVHCSNDVDLVVT